MNIEARIMEPGQIEPPAGAIPRLRLPDPRTVFSRRAERFHAVAQGHPMGGFLALLEQVADGQQDLLERYPWVALPSSEQLSLSREHSLPPLSIHSWERDPAWREGFYSLVTQMRGGKVSTEAAHRLDSFLELDPEQLEQQASRLVGSDYASLDPALTPFLAAALQTYWVAMATRLGESAFSPIDSPFLCPVCGSRPVASVVQAGGAETGLRYLHCALCATEWHMVRVKCSNCESTEGIAYYEQEGENGSIKAESCDTCNTYLKILHLPKNYDLEPCADDCATLALDLLMDEDGKQRSGPNLYLHPGNF